MKLVYVAIVFQQTIFLSALSTIAAKGTGGGFKPQIMGGSAVTNISKFPYHVGILKNEETLICNGALIDDDWVLTTASCASRQSESKSVVLATVNHSRTETLGRFSKPCVYLEIDKVDVILHPDFVSTSLSNDLALIKLPYALNLNSPYIKSVKFNKDAKKSFANEMATVTGFGKTNSSAAAASDLSSISLKVMDKDACKLATADYGNVDSLMCVATSDTNGPCELDDGAPLVVMGKDQKPLLVGIYASYESSDNCSSTETYRMFTQVAPFSKWIAKIMSSKK